MEKETLQPLSGFRDLLDPRKARLLGVLAKTFQRFGYRPLETPIIEKQDILLGKMGDEAQKLLYLFEDSGKRKVGLRYDLTVPLSRFVAANYRELPLPFKRYEIGPVFRAEKPQKGRYRQFTQADIDVVGDGGSLGSETEILEVVAATSDELGLKITFEINDRQLLIRGLDELKIAESSRGKLLRLLDKKDKVSEIQLQKELSSLELTDVQKRNVTHLFLSGQNEELETWEKLVGKEAVGPVEKLLAHAKRIGLMAKFSPAMVRGLDYYTGLIFEGKLIDGESSSVVGGGRYDGLVEDLVGQKLPAVGISFGVDRLLEALKEDEPSAIFVANIDSTLEDDLRLWVKKLRQSGTSVELYAAPTDIGTQLKYASRRGYKKVILPLEDSWGMGTVEVKDLISGAQRAIKRADIEDERT